MRIWTRETKASKDNKNYHPFVIIKLCGVRADQLPALHRYCDEGGPAEADLAGTQFTFKHPQGIRGARMQLAKILKADYDPSHSAFVVEVKVYVLPDLAVGFSDAADFNTDRRAITPQQVITGLFDAIDWFPPAAEG